MKEKIKALFKDPDFLLIFAYILILPGFGLLNRPIGTVRNLYAPIDDRIPFVPSFILIYHSWFPFLMMNAFAFYKHERSEYRKYILQLIIGQFAAYLTFIFFQTDVSRATNLGNSFFEKIISLTYKVDNHYNGFPSVHALTTTIVIIYVLRSGFKPVYKVLAVFYSVLIMASLLLVKQHAFWDLPAGIVYGFLTYPLATRLFKRLFPDMANNGEKIKA